MAGCAGPAAPDAGTPALPESLSVQRAAQMVRPGLSKAEVAAALGKAAAVRFAGGQEVWVYRDLRAVGPDGVPAEFVILFDAAGAVKKTRVRPPGGVPAG